MLKLVINKLKKFGLGFFSHAIWHQNHNIDSSFLIPMDHYEEYFFKFKDLSKCSRIFRVKSEIDYNSNLPVVIKAVNELKRIHPFLRANLHKQNGKYYFCISPHKEQKKISNVEFLYLRNRADKEPLKFDDAKFSEISNLLIEKQLDEEINYEKEPLWKLTFIKLQSESSGCHLYDIILTTHHSISEERCNYRLFSQLLDVIEKMYKNEYQPNENAPNQIMPSMKEVLDILCSQNKESSNKNDIDEDSCLIRPSFINDKEAIKNSFKYPSNLTKSDFKNIEICSLKKNEKVENVQSLIQISKRNKNKFIFNQIECKKFNCLLKKCKQNDVRLACCLNLMSLISLKLLYTKNGINRPISYSNMISLRAILNNPQLMGKTLYDNLGYYVAEQLGSNKLDLDEFDLDKRFWNICKEENIKLNESLQQKQFISNTNDENFNPEKTNHFIDCLISNIGNLPSYTHGNSMHEILSTNFAGLVESKYFFCFTSFHTLNKQHGFGVFYNSHFINRDLIENYVSNFYLILNELVKE